MHRINMSNMFDINQDMSCDCNNSVPRQERNLDGGIQIQLTFGYNIRRWSSP
jgi:hypothetical protein